MFNRPDEDFAVFTVNQSSIREAVKQATEDKIIALSKNPSVTYQIADMAIMLVNKYVPMKTGDLRMSAYITQHARQTQIHYGHPYVGKTALYARAQYDREEEHPNWSYTTPGTRGDWLNVLTPGNIEYQQLVEYATNLMRKEVKK